MAGLASSSTYDQSSREEPQRQGCHLDLCHPLPWARHHIPGFSPDICNMAGVGTDSGLPGWS